MKRLLLLSMLLIVEGQRVEFFDASDSNITEVARRYSYYKQGPRTLTNKPEKIVENLEEIINLFQPCLVHIINYGNMPITVQSTPILVSRYDVVEVLYRVENQLLATHGTRYSHRKRLLNFESLQHNTSAIKWCKQHRIDMMCIDIPSVDKSTASKPWHCEMHLYLFPPSDPIVYVANSENGKFRLLIPGSFRRMFWSLSPNNIDIRDGYTEDVLIVNRHRYDIVAADATDLETFWANSLTEMVVNLYDVSVTVHRELLSLKIKYIGKDPLRNYEIVRIVSMSLLCRTCNALKSLERVPVGIPKELQSLQQVIDRLNELNKDNVIYRMWPLGEVLVSGFFLFNEKFPNTENRQKLNQLIADRNQSLNDLRWEIEARLLGNVFRNATFLTFPSPCKNDFPLACNEYFQPFIYVVPSGCIEHTHFHLHRKALTFVSCGSPEHTGLAFIQLVSVFDNYVWMYLIISVLSTAAFCALVHMYKQMPEVKVLLGKLRERGKVETKSKLKRYVQDYLFPSVMSYCKVLIEQGDPINIQLWNLPCLGSTFACFLFTAVVISNAYKNENITQLTLPRASIPYDTFNVLINNSFDIFSRGTLIGGFYDNKVYWSSDIVKFYNEFTPFAEIYGKKREHHLTTIFRSEAYNFGHSEISQRRFFLPSENFSDTAKFVMNNSKVLPNWFNILWYSYDGGCDLFRTNDSCDPLRFCNKSAILLPDLEAHTKFYQMKRDGSSNVYLGQDELIENKYGIMFTRWIHADILQRMKGLYASGAVEWWDKFVLKFLSRLRVGFYDNEEEIVRASNMNGNIAVVFTILPGGITIAVFTFIYEMINSIKKLYAFLCENVMSRGNTTAVETVPTSS